MTIIVTVHGCGAEFRIERLMTKEGDGSDAITEAIKEFKKANPDCKDFTVRIQNY